MGEPVGDEYESGDSCAQCWGPGKTFGDVSTPKKIFITWAGLSGIFAGGNKTFIGIQEPGAPCLWHYNDGVYEGFGGFDAGASGCRIKLVGATPFVLASGGWCALVLTSGPVVTCTIS